MIDLIQFFIAVTVCEKVDVRDKSKPKARAMKPNYQGTEKKIQTKTDNLLLLN